MSQAAIQTLVTIAIVAAACAYLARGIWKSMRRRKATGVGCDSDCGCSH